MTGAHIPMPTKLAARWYDHRTFLADGCPSAVALGALKRAEGRQVSVAIPALNEAATIGPICATIARHLIDHAGLVDELIVLNGPSTDATASIARANGARVVDVDTLMPHVQPAPGKGDSLWKSLTVVRGDLVVWIDADIRGFEPHFVTRLLAPLITDPTIDFVKGFYERPLELDGVLHASGGGRVTELLARPLLDLLFPELGGFQQPLAGEYAGRVEVLRRLPFFSGYSVETGMLIDLLDEVGLDGMAQADLGRRVHRNRPLHELSTMAYAIARTILRRAQDRGRIASIDDFPIRSLLSRGEDGHLQAQAIREVERPALSRSVLGDELAGAAR